MRTDCHSFIEPLEPRVAPASVLAFTDSDGDQVKIVSSSGDLNAPGVAKFALGGLLQSLTLTDPSFQGANITTVVAKSATGDGLVNIGRIDATGRDLGSVKIKGDFAGISCGDADTSTPALKLLDVRSMGNFGTFIQGGGGLPFSDIVGRLGSLVVHGDFKDAVVNVLGGATLANGSIGAIRIGGSLLGGGIVGSGMILSTGDIGSVKIGGDLLGGVGADSGRLFCNGTLSSLSIGGSLIGAAGLSSGLIDSRNIGAVKIGKDIRGGLGPNSGLITSSGNFASVTVGGSVIGGGGNNSGEIFAAGALGSVRLGGDLMGGSIAGTDPTLDASGYIQGDHIGSVVIGGSVITGSDGSTTGGLLKNASIRAVHDIGSVTVKGSLIGTKGPSGNTAVQIIAAGQAAPVNGVDLAIGKIAVGGRAENATILAGWSVNVGPQNGNASIGTVSVRGDWVAGSIAAGVLPGPGGFGTGGSVINNAGDAIIAKIASITIGGAVVGTGVQTDHFGFTAQQIGSFKSLGFIAKLTAGPSNDRLEAPSITRDITIFEI